MKYHPCNCFLAKGQAEKACDMGRRARKNMLALEDNPYPSNPNIGCDGPVGSVHCILAREWETGWTEETKALLRESLPKKEVSA